MMPLLAAEPCLFPDDLLERPRDEFQSGEWWALRTYPRTEKKIARYLIRHSIAFFLPVCRKQHRTRQSLRYSYLPLFPGYLFLHGDAEARLTAQQTNLLTGYLAVPDQQGLHRDLARVHALMKSGMPLFPEPGLEPGTYVAINSGPLEGFVGKVLRTGKRLSFVVEVEFIRRRVSVEIDGSMIRPLSASSSLP